MDRQDGAPCSARTVFVRMVWAACRSQSAYVREDEVYFSAYRQRDHVSCASESPPKAEELCSEHGVNCTSEVRARLASCSGSSGFRPVNPREEKAHSSAVSGASVYSPSQPKNRNPPPARNPAADNPYSFPFTTSTLRRFVLPGVRTGTPAAMTTRSPGETRSSSFAQSTAWTRRFSSVSCRRLSTG